MSNRRQMNEVRHSKPRQRCDIKMVVMRMRDQDHIDRRQVRKGDAGIVHPFRPDKAERRCALRPHRIDQNVEACDLDEPARMPDIGQPPGRAFDPRRADGRHEATAPMPAISPWCRASNDRPANGSRSPWFRGATPGDRKNARRRSDRRPDRYSKARHSPAYYIARRRARRANNATVDASRGLDLFSGRSRKRLEMLTADRRDAEVPARQRDAPSGVLGVSRLIRGAMVRPIRGR